MFDPFLTSPSPHLECIGGPKRRTDPKETAFPQRPALPHHRALLTHVDHAVLPLLGCSSAGLRLSLRARLCTGTRVPRAGPVRSRWAQVTRRAPDTPGAVP